MLNTIALAVGWRAGGGKHEWKEKQEALTEVQVRDGTGLPSRISEEEPGCI